MGIDVVFAVDRNFLPYCAVAMASALRNKGAAALSFHVVGEGLEETDKHMLRQSVGGGCSLQFYTVPEEKVRVYEVKWGKGRLSKNVFYRCLLASVLPREVSRVLYLDCDVLVLVPLDELWTVDLEGKALAAVPDAYVVNPVHCRRLGYSVADNYFNGGVLLFNLDYWRAHGLEERCRDYFRAHADQLVYNDQDLLNGLFHDNKVLLDMKWNVQEGAYRLPKGKPAGWLPPHAETLAHPAILHYSGRKPWQYHCMHPLRGLFFDYQELTVWKGCVPCKSRWARLHRFVHLLPYTLGLKRNKYVSLNIK